MIQRRINNRKNALYDCLFTLEFQAKRCNIWDALTGNMSLLENVPIIHYTPKLGAHYLPEEGEGERKNVVPPLSDTLYIF